MIMLGKIADTILAQIERLESENKELNDTIESEKALQINYTYADIRKWLQHFRTLDYSKTKNRKDLIDTFIYRVLLYDDKMKVIFNLKGGQKNELLLNLIFPDYPDGNGGEDENSAKEKEVDISTSNSDVNAECAYTSRVVEVMGIEPISESVYIELSTRLAFCVCLTARMQRAKSDTASFLCFAATGKNEPPQLHRLNVDAAHNQAIQLCLTTAYKLSCKGKRGSARRFLIVSV